MSEEISDLNRSVVMNDDVITVIATNLSFPLMIEAINELIVTHIQSDQVFSTP